MDYSKLKNYEDKILLNFKNFHKKFINKLINPLKVIEIESKEKGNEKDKPEKIEICYICHKKFNINADDESYYWQGKFPFCAYCAEFYGFYR